MIKLIVNKKLCYVECNDANLLKQINLLLSFVVQGAFFSPLYRSGRWDGRKKLFNIRNNSFHIGLLYRLILWLKSENIEYDLEDKRKIKEDFKLEYLQNNRILYVDNGKNIILRYYQRDGIKKIIENKFGLNNTRGILCLPPRSGKTLMTGVTGLVLNKYPILHITHKIDLAYQTKKVYEKLFKKKIGLVGDGHFDIKSDIVIATIQSICSTYDIKEKFDNKEKIVGHKEEFRKFIDNVKLAICDEVHVSGADTFQELTKYLVNLEYGIGCSGTPSREDGADLLVEQLWGNIVYELSRDEGVKNGFLLPIKIYFIKLPKIKVNLSDYQSQKRQGLNENKYIPLAIKKIIKRLDKKNMSSCIIIKEKTQGKLIHEDLKCEYLHGGISGEHREKVYDKLNKKQIKHILSTVTDIGVDIPSLDSVIIAAPSKSKVSAMQRIRSGTPYKDKKYGYVFILCPSIEVSDIKDKNYLEAHVKKLWNILSKEKTFILKEINYNEL